MGDAFEAVEYALEEWKLEPNNSDRHWGVCLMLVQVWDEASSLNCIDSLLDVHPDYYEAQNWRTWVVKDKEASIALTEEQITQFPQVLYYKLQLAQKYVVSKAFKATIDLLAAEYPKLLSDSFEITAYNICYASYSPKLVVLMRLY